MHVTQGGDLAVKNWLVNLDRHASIASALAEASCPVLVCGNSERIELDDATAPASRRGNANADSPRSTPFAPTAVRQMGKRRLHARRQRSRSQ